MRYLAGFGLESRRKNRKQMTVLISINYSLHLVTHFFKSSSHSFVFLWGNHIVNLQNHLNDLRCEFELMLLGSCGFKDTLLVHICCTLMVCIHSDEWIMFLDLLFADWADVLDWIVSWILCQSQGDFFQSISKSAHCILFNAFDLVGGRSYCDWTRQFSGTTTAHNIIVTNHITHNTDCVVETTSCLITNNSGAATNQNCDCLWVFAILDENYSIVWSTETYFFNWTGFAKFVCSYFLKAGNDSCSSCDG